MNILNKKNCNWFLLAGFVFALILVGSPTLVTAQGDAAIVDEYNTSLKNVMEPLGCNTRKECDDYCSENSKKVSECSAYHKVRGNAPSIVDAMEEAGCDGSLKECTAYCNGAVTLECRSFFGYSKDFNGLNKLYDKLRKAESILRNGGGPGGCSSAASCRQYCKYNDEQDTFPTVCKPFEVLGFHYYVPEFLDEQARWTQSIKNSVESNIAIPKNCPDNVQCIVYCLPLNSISCIDFEEQTGLISSQDAAIDKKFLDFKIKGGKIFAQCNTLNGRVCASECLDNGYFNGYQSECLALAEKGLTMTPKELDIYKKFLAATQAGYPTPAECSTVGECQDVCSRPENYSECTEFAKKAGWIEEEIPPEKQAVFAAMQKGESPGKCKDVASCRNYCEDIDHIEECVNFVEKFNLANGDELKEIRQMADAKKAGVAFPGNCKSKEKCLAYCESPAHAVECMEFAQKAGLLKGEDVEAVNKILPYLKSGGKLPGGCTSKESCDAYCESETNTNECVDFAVGAGFITKEESDIVKKVGGKGPGNCKSREACDSYCKDEAHVDECIDFAVKAGFISQEDAAMAKKFGITSGGPGGCKSKAECQSFCALPENQETCSNWAKAHGMDMGGGPGGQAGPGGCKSKEECTTYCTANQEDELCKKMMQGFSGQGGQAGPGGCKNQEECTAYCKDHQEECQKLNHPGSGQNQEQQNQQQIQNSPQNQSPTNSGGPGGCKNQEECTAYCKDHQEECQNFSPPGGGGGSGGGGEQVQPPVNSGGPGGCKTQEECKTYCMANPQDSGCNFQQTAPQSLLQYSPFGAILKVFLEY